MGQTALTGIGLCFPITMTVSAFAALIGYGGAPLSSILRGSKRDQRAEQVLGNCVTALTVLGIVVPLACFLLREPVLYLFGASDATYPYANEYITIYLMGSLPVMLTLGLNTFINAQGFTGTAWSPWASAPCAILCWTPIFIFVLGLGVAGAAIATVISPGGLLPVGVPLPAGQKEPDPAAAAVSPAQLAAAGKDLRPGSVQLYHADHRERHLRRVQCQPVPLRRGYLCDHHDSGHLHQPDLHHDHSGVLARGPSRSPDTTMARRLQPGAPVLPVPDRRLPDLCPWWPGD